jgi:hypothetical protein
MIERCGVWIPALASLGRNDGGLLVSHTVLPYGAANFV